jgi:hypothetical protein
MKALVSLFLVGICNVYAQPYHLRDVYDGSNYLEKFEFLHGNDMDKSHGSVLLVNMDTCSCRSNHSCSWVDKNYALEKGLVSSTSSSFKLYPGSGKIEGKRPSVQLRGKPTYDAKSLFVFDVAHMPEAGCGVWPALWTHGKTPDGRLRWPYHGEIGLSSLIASLLLLTWYTKTFLKVSIS